MMNQCRACKYFIVAYDGKTYGYDCEYFNNRAEIDFTTDCKFFKKLEDTENYVEYFTKCDECYYKSSCSLQDVTNIYDSHDHWYEDSDNSCLGDYEIDDEDDDE